MTHSYLAFEIKDTVLASILTKARIAYPHNPNNTFALFRAERTRVADALSYWGVLQWLRGTLSWELTEFGWECLWIFHADDTITIAIPLEEE